MDKVEVTKEIIKITIEELYEALKLLEDIAEDEYEIELEDDSAEANDN